MTSSRRLWHGALMVLAFLLAAGARAQFNIDLDFESAPPQNGGGVPSSSFSAAAPGHAGFWNSVPAGSNGPMTLRDLSGIMTSVTITGPSSGIGSSHNFPANTGDYALLLNDGHDGGDPAFDSYTFSNVPNGSYRVYTYVAWPSSVPHPSSVSILGAAGGDAHTATGSMPGNQFVLGQTHTIHDIQLTGGTFTVQIQQLGQFAPMLNGIQIVAVPEPTTLALTAFGVVVLLRRRRSGKP